MLYEFFDVDNLVFTLVSVLEEHTLRLAKRISCEIYTRHEIKAGTSPSENRKLTILKLLSSHLA